MIILGGKGVTQHGDGNERTAPAISADSHQHLVRIHRDILRNRLKQEQATRSVEREKESQERQKGLRTLFWHRVTICVLTAAVMALTVAVSYG